MNRLNTQLHRLYASPSSAPNGEMSPEQVRGLVIELRRPADWDALRAVWQGVQTDFGWPEPAIAVDGNDAFQLWFSLAEPVGVRVATALLDLLVTRYGLPDTPRRLALGWVGGPKRDGSGLWSLPTPIRHPVSGRWSAFVAPDLARIFSDEPGLDLPPREDAQAELLSGLISVSPDSVQACWPRVRHGQEISEGLQPERPEPELAGNHPTNISSGVSVAGAELASETADVARRYLVRVVNDPQVDTAQRIEAAKALLLAGR